MRRLLAVLLTLTMIVPLFVSCGGKTEKLTLFEDGEVSVVYDAELLTSLDLKSFVAEIESAANVTVSLHRTDSGNEPKIYLGNVNAENCRAVTSGLRMKDYALQISNGDYVIGARTKDALLKAMEVFVSDILPQVKKDVLKLTSKMNYLYEDSYRVEVFTVGGVPMTKMQIVIPKAASVSEYRTAVLLRESLKYSMGIDLAICRGAAEEGTPGKILIGSSLCKKAKTEGAHDWNVAVNGTDLEITAASFLGYESVIKSLESDVFSPRNTATALNDDTSFSGTGNASAALLSHDGDVRIMFNNIHGNANYTEFPTPPVAQMMSEVYKAYLPDVLGLQECSPEMYDKGKIAELLQPEYTIVPVTRNHTPLFYRKDTVELLRSGYLCYNDAPYTDSAYEGMLQGYTASKLLQENVTHDGTAVMKNGRKDGSKGVTWAIFRSKSTGHIFMAASTHLWWESNDKGDSVTRQIQMTYMKDLILNEANKYLAETDAETETMPIFVGGDYNCRNTGSTQDDLAKMSSKTPIILCPEGTDSAFTNTNMQAPADKRNTYSTHHSYAKWNEELGIYEDPKSSANEYIHALDYIFANRSASEMYQVARSAMSGETYSYLSSDHCPVMIDVSFTDAAPKA